MCWLTPWQRLPHLPRHVDAHSEPRLLRQGMGALLQAHACSPTSACVLTNLCLCAYQPLRAPLPALPVSPCVCPYRRLPSCALD